MSRTFWSRRFAGGSSSSSSSSMSSSSSSSSIEQQQQQQQQQQQMRSNFLRYALKTPRTPSIAYSPSIAMNTTPSIANFLILCIAALLSLTPPCSALPGDVLAASDFISEDAPYAQDWRVTYGVPGLVNKAEAAAAAANVILTREGGGGMGEGLKGTDTGNQKWYFTSPASFFDFDTTSSYNGIIQVQPPHPPISQPLISRCKPLSHTAHPRSGGCSLSPGSAPSPPPPHPTSSSPAPRNRSASWPRCAISNSPSQTPNPKPQVFLGRRVRSLWRQRLFFASK
jgi:hypothetical protein